VIPVAAFLLATVAAVVFTPFVRQAARRAGLIANPSKERWHSQATALFGGVGIFLAFAASVLVLALLPGGGLATAALTEGFIPGIVAAASLMFVTGLVDDRYNLRPLVKFGLQVLGGVLLVTMGVSYPVTDATAFNALLTIFWFVTLTNAVNLIDNMDGVSAGVTSVAAAVLGVLFALEGAIGLSLLAFALAGATAGFLVYNFKPASIFMGDSGSLFLGAMLAGLGAAYPSVAVGGGAVMVLLIPLLLAFVPLLDTSLVSFSRTLAGFSISRGGRDHIAHRLVALGLSERQVALLLYAATALGGSLAIMYTVGARELVVIAGIGYVVAMVLLVNYLARLHEYEGGDTARPATKIISDLVYRRRAPEVLLDVVIFAVAYYAAFLVRFDADLSGGAILAFQVTVPLVVAVQLLAFFVMRVYRSLWQQMTMPDVHRVLKAALLGAPLAATAVYLVDLTEALPRSVFVLNFIFVAVLALGVRISIRSLDQVRQQLEPAGEATLIYGAGKGGDLAVRTILASPQLKLRPLGFIDDDPRKWGRLIHGIPVLGGRDDLDAIVRRTAASCIVVGTERLQEEAFDQLSRWTIGEGVQLLRFQCVLKPVTWLEVAGEPQRVAISPMASVGAGRRPHWHGSALPH
jgi:UDP-GlcNAc:undecaprenyl-phosphate/decaprenyl-phosphate GlcNAc-1-phosphate transferase